ncbi:hypothetical protein [Aeoliella sp.]|uniref:hypothetical protein n=1 Tax=Aeoliella sp. TaxID=2795800 RepID=UPI003CCBE082
MKSKKSWFRFGIGTLLFLTACLAGYFAGYQLGAEAKLEAIRQQEVCSIVYDVSDLVVMESDGELVATDFDPLLDAIYGTIASDSWVVNGGPDAYIQPHPSTQSLVISQKPAVHNQIRDLLAQLQRAAEKRDHEKVVDADE